MQRKGQAIYHYLNFSTFSVLSLAQGCSQENLPSPASLVLVVAPLVPLGLLSFLPTSVRICLRRRVVQLWALLH